MGQRLHVHASDEHVRAIESRLDCPQRLEAACEQGRTEQRR
jgi:hypothetical protein